MKKRGLSENILILENGVVNPLNRIDLDQAFQKDR